MVLKTLNFFIEICKPTIDQLFKNSHILGINVHVHVTPYQIEDVYRPWIHEEENEFCNTLQNMGISVKRILHFADKPRNLKLHFNVLKAIGNYTQ